MAKQSAPKGKAEVAAQVAKKAARGTVSLVVWSIGIVVLVVAGYMVFREEGPVTEDRTPEGIVEVYSEMVKVYIPPAQAKPGASTVSEWLEYFDADTGDWFRANVDKLSYVRNQRDPVAWKAMTEGDRRSEAMVYLLTLNPLRGGKVTAARMAEGGASAEIEIRAGGQVYKVSMQKDGRTWRARELMGKKAEVNATLSGVELPK